MTMNNQWYEPRDAKVQAVKYDVTSWATDINSAAAPEWLKQAIAEGVVWRTRTEQGGTDNTLTINNPFLGEHICEDGWYVCRAHDGTICACAPEGFALGYVEATPA